MDLDLRSYVRVYNAIPPENCDIIMQELNELDGWDLNKFYDARDRSSFTVSGQREFITNYNIIPSHNYMEEKIYDTIYNYIGEIGFHWFNSWEGFTSPRWNRYHKGKVMKEHCDHIHEMFDGERKGVPILSVLGALNDDYEGGELVMFEDQVLPMPKGSIIVFPSNFLYPHKVEPVTSGVRQTYVSWVF